MTDSTVGRMPAMKAVWMEQLRVVGLAIRREAALAGLVLALGSLAVIATSRVPVVVALLNGEMLNPVFSPGMLQWGFLTVLVALLFPLVVWKGEHRFGDTPLWSMPVRHQRHVLLRVAAGWVWLMAIVGGALVLATLTILVSGGTLGVEKGGLLVLDPVGASAGTPGAVEWVSWTTPWWEWARLFTSATAAYMLASTLLLGTARPELWAIGLFVTGAVMAAVANIWDIGWIQRVLDFVDWQIGGVSLFSQLVEIPNGWAMQWTHVPTAKTWAAASAFWISLGLAGVLVASGRPRNQ